jgi:hypothetical protein
MTQTTAEWPTPRWLVDQLAAEFGVGPEYGRKGPQGFVDREKCKLLMTKLC